MYMQISLTVEGILPSLAQRNLMREDVLVVAIP
jgi:hypothetical protein